MEKLRVQIHTRLLISMNVDVLTDDEKAALKLVDEAGKEHVEAAVQVVHRGRQAERISMIKKDAALKIQKIQRGRTTRKVHKTTGRDGKTAASS